MLAAYQLTTLVAFFCVSSDHQAVSKCIWSTCVAPVAQATVHMCRAGFFQKKHSESNNDGICIQRRQATINWLFKWYYELLSFLDILDFILLESFQRATQYVCQWQKLLGTIQSLLYALWNGIVKILSKMTSEIALKHNFLW